MPRPSKISDILATIRTLEQQIRELDDSERPQPSKKAAANKPTATKKMVKVDVPGPDTKGKELRYSPQDVAAMVKAGQMTGSVLNHALIDGEKIETKSMMQFVRILTDKVAEASTPVQRSAVNMKKMLRINIVKASVAPDHANFFVTPSGKYAVQNIDHNRVWQLMPTFATHLGVPIEMHWEWNEKARKLHGQRGRAKFAP